MNQNQKSKIKKKTKEKEQMRDLKPKKDPKGGVLPDSGSATLAGSCCGGRHFPPSLPGN